MTRIEELVDRHYARLHRLAYGMTRSHADADDLCQETLVAAWRGLDRFRGESQPFTWLAAILRNRFLKRARRSDPVPVAPTASAADPAIWSSVESLSEPLRETVTLFYAGGLSYDEIAGLLGVPVGTVRSRLHAGREALKKLMGADA